MDRYEPVCLNPFVLEAVYLQLEQEYKDLDTTQEVRHFILFIFFVSMCKYFLQGALQDLLSRKELHVKQIGVRVNPTKLTAVGGS